jgi:hypothetical protein
MAGGVAQVVKYLVQSKLNTEKRGWWEKESSHFVQNAINFRFPLCKIFQWA